MKHIIDSRQDKKQSSITAYQDIRKSISKRQLDRQKSIDTNIDISKANITKHI